VDDLSQKDFHALGEFRFQVRKFLHFSEEAARSEGLEPQQHQMLLAIKASGQLPGPSIGQLAEHLFLRHHSVVGLVDRSEMAHLVRRVRGEDDRRQVRVELTTEGSEKLHRLAREHREELMTSGPALVQALHEILEARHAATR
jgi:DNA-binding MarR family transcriptional regulator